MGASVTMDLTGLVRGLETIAARVEIAARVAVGQAGAVIESEIKQKLTTSSHKKGTPTPSAPGRPPSLVTGTLRRSVQVEIYGSGAFIHADIGPTVIYGRIQELGGTAGRGSQLPARPYVRPGADDAIRSGRVEDIFVRAWRGALGV